MKKMPPRLSCLLLLAVACNPHQSAALQPPTFLTSTRLPRTSSSTLTFFQMSSLPQGHINIKSLLTPRRVLLASSGASAAAYLFMLQKAAAAQPKFKRIPTQFIAALSDPNASARVGSNHCRLWREDPGLRGVWLQAFKDLQQSRG